MNWDGAFTLGTDIMFLLFNTKKIIFYNLYVYFVILN